MNWKQSLVEALKMAFRVSWIAAFPIIIDGLNTGVVDYKKVGFAVLVALLMSADRFIHSWDAIPFKGLSPL